VTFGWPLVLLALVLVPLAAVGYVLLDRRRRATLEAWGNPALEGAVVHEGPGRRRHLPVAILLLAVTVLLVGAARPKLNASVSRNDAVVMLAVDTSYSMAAKDVPPTRLGAARTAALGFAKEAPKDLLIGLVSFETGAHLVVPPSADRDLLRHGLDELRPADGTALGDSIKVALDAAGARKLGAKHRPIAILVLSDGAQTQGSMTPGAAAARARALDVPIYTVALGTAGGVVERPLAGGLKERIQVPPDPAALRGMAFATRGVFFTAASPHALKMIYEHLATQLGSRPVHREVTSALAGLGGLLLLGGATLSVLWFQRAP
jgi:Ca-activated chloride channel family protein